MGLGAQRRPSDDELIARSLRVASELALRASSHTGRADRRRIQRLRRLLASEGGTALVFSIADRVLRPFDARTAARQLASVTNGPIAGTSRADAALLKAGGLVGRLAPRPVVGLAGARLRRETAPLIYPSEPASTLGRRLAGLWAAHRRPNLNLLGEAVLGWGEAGRRTDAVETLLGRPDVDCVSVKVSAIAAGLSLVDFEGSLERLSEPLRRLYRAAMASDPPKLVNLDMEEHRDLELTLELFMRVLSEPEFGRLTGGIALQAYLPDTHGALEQLLGWATDRKRQGGAPIRIRLVKGANLAMETVEAELHGWPAAPYASKAETDASYKRLLERLIEAASSGAAAVGVASHNLFDIALALVLAEDAGVDVDIEMLAGMADAQAAAVAERTGRMLFYLPITAPRDFRNALAYLARRLDENATPEGFLRQGFSMLPGSPAWDEQSERFSHAVVERHTISTARRHHQDRAEPPTFDESPGAWRNEPDTDLTIGSNRSWARSTLHHAPLHSPSASPTDVDDALTRATRSAQTWGRSAPGERRHLLLRAAQSMERGRGDALGVMAIEAGKTVGEGDPEVSEGVDYARWYARATELIEVVDAEVESEPLGVVVVAPPWNFPYAIPAGGVLAALAAGNAVILKPSPEAPGTARVLAEQLWAAGVPEDVLQFVAAPDGATGERLVSDARVGGVVLTGSAETAGLFQRWSPHRRVLAETNGKNAMVIDATADVDQAVGDLVRSAFGHAGQKCSAASLAIVDGTILDRSPFLRQLADATRSLRVGLSTDPATEVGPIVGPFTPSLDRALTRLDAGESWLVEPRALDADRRLWSPGVRLGVRSGSWAHLNEWFGPVLGVMRAKDLDDAIRLQNAVAYGLTAGLQSLDPARHVRWSDAVEAGNLYVNRSTTGAIVGRQPFGGWKASSAGPTAKAGGPNYLLGLRRWRDRAPVSVDTAAASYRRWWDGYFARGHDVAELEAEANVLRYRPHVPGVWVRAVEAVADDEIAKASHAARLAGTPLRISSLTTRAGLMSALRRTGYALEVESAASFASRLADHAGARVRLLGSAEDEVVAAAAEHGATVLDEPICSHGRIELVRWLREQSVSRSLHRYGNVVYHQARASDADDPIGLRVQN